MLVDSTTNKKIKNITSTHTTITHQAQSRTLHGFTTSSLESSHTLQPCTTSSTSVSISIVSHLPSSPQSLSPDLQSFASSPYPSRFDPLTTNIIASSLADLSEPHGIRAFYVGFASIRVDLLSFLPLLTLQASRNFRTSQ